MVLLLRPFRTSWTVKNSVHHVKPLASVLLKLCKKWTWNQKKMALNKFALSSWHTSKHEKCDAVLCLVSQLCPTLCDPMDCSLPGSSVHGDSPGKNTRVGCHACLMVILPTQGSNPRLLYCRRFLYHLIHQFSSVQSLSRVRLFATPWTAACQASLSITSPRSPPKPMSIESVMPSNRHILSSLLIPSLPALVFPSIRVFSNELALRFRWPKYWSFSFSISPSREHPGLISFRIDWLDFLAV